MQVSLLTAVELHAEQKPFGLTVAGGPAFLEHEVRNNRSLSHAVAFITGKQVRMIQVNVLPGAGTLWTRQKDKKFLTIYRYINSY